MKIKELLTGPEKWTQRVLARKADGDMCSWRHPEAVRWCLVEELDI